VPAGTGVPAAGSVRSTLPAGWFGTITSETGPTVSPSSRSARAADIRSMPTTLGTFTWLPRLAMIRSIALPGHTALPAFGLVRSTVPAGWFDTSSVTDPTDSPASRSTRPARIRSAPIRSGTCRSAGDGGGITTGGRTTTGGGTTTGDGTTTGAGCSTGAGTATGAGCWAVAASGMGGTSAIPEALPEGAAIATIRLTPAPGSSFTPAAGSVRSTVPAGCAETWSEVARRFSPMFLSSVSAWLLGRPTSTGTSTRDCP
jgi:hypothetical protein